VKVRPLLFLLLGLIAGLARAQSIHWDPPGGTLPVGQTAQLQLVFADCSPQGTPALPKVDGLTLEYVGQSSNLSLINGDLSRSLTLNYAALLSRKQRVELPAFTVDTNKGRLRVAAARFDPAGATVGGSGVALEEVASSHLTLAPTTVWAGEVFDLEYTIDVAHGYYPDFGRGAFEWNPSPLIIEDWSQPAPFEKSNGAEPRNGIGYRTRAIARTPGTYRLNPVNQLVNLSVGVSGFGFFQQRQYQQFSVASNTPSVQVLPLPPAPPGFTGIVGEFTLKAHVVPTQVAVGEPVTWTLELSGIGNWPDIAGLPPREASQDFQVVQPKPKRTMAEGKRMEGTLVEDVVLVPTRAGTYSLSPVSLTVFNPKRGTYEKLTLANETVVVTPAAPAGPASTAAGRTAPGPGAPAITAGPPAPAPRVPAPPSALPRDPLPGGDSAAAPLARRRLFVLAAAPFAALILLGLGLAWRRARRTDPLNPQREARRRLGATLASLSAADEGSRPARLLDWQHDATILWQIGRAAPGAEAFTDPAWAGLWREAEACLYGPVPSLPADWIGRAEAALAAKRVPRRRWLRLFRLRHLLPRRAAAALALVGLAAGAALAPPARAADDGALYRRGDFAGAEKAWRLVLNRHPLDPSAHYNLSLALAQQDRWGEAAAQAAAALVERPSDPSIRAQFILACEQSGVAPAPVAPFLDAGRLSSLALLASPADWQRLELAAALLVALALAGALLAAHGLARGRWPLRAAAAALVLGLAAGLGGWLGVRAYGLAADPRAAVTWRAGTLRSIPTEADAAQKTTPLPAGSAAVVDKTYLGWVRLRFAEGPTGWVRDEEVVRLWQ
jgi:tetratricopeptide (TPR) repeat protein